MKNRLFFLFFIFLCFKGYSQSVFISEINAKDGTKGFEISGPSGTDLSTYTIEYLKKQGNNVHAGGSPTLTGTIDDEGSGFGAVFFPFNLKKDGILVLIGPGSVVATPIVAYGTGIVSPITFGTANGMTVSTVGGDPASTPNKTLQKTDTGWIFANPTSLGTLNSNLTLSVKRNEIRGFKLFPTVVNNGRFLITTNNSQVKNVQIYSILGSLVYEKQVQPYENVNIRNLSTGLYFVLVEEDKKVSVKKILVN